MIQYLLDSRALRSAVAAAAASWSVPSVPSSAAAAAACPAASCRAAAESFNPTDRLFFVEKIPHRAALPWGSDAVAAWAASFPAAAACPWGWAFAAAATAASAAARDRYCEAGR
uniref:Uncharacterized protein n=1 Tax=Pristionchus pacificus TaxID=54126 RepID=A0A2A6BG18_PRIPA|eukprot:PDM64829.1 hypothetical protein PRIPAC_53085 [Pristionchus pacificus]